jgi:hypothetical protein
VPNGNDERREGTYQSEQVVRGKATLTKDSSDDGDEGDAFNATGRMIGADNRAGRCAQKVLVLDRDRNAEAAEDPVAKLERVEVSTAAYACVDGPLVCKNLEQAKGARRKPSCKSRTALREQSSDGDSFRGRFDPTLCPRFAALPRWCLH